MTAPQITILTMIAINLLLSAHLHGKEKQEKHNFWVKFINAIILISILYWGNFFK